MGGIVVLFEAQGLPVERAIKLGEFSSSPHDVCFVLVPAACGGASEVVAQEIEPPRCEET